MQGWSPGSSDFGYIASHGASITAGLPPHVLSRVSSLQEQVLLAGRCSAGAVAGAAGAALRPQLHDTLMNSLCSV